MLALSKKTLESWRIVRKKNVSPGPKIARGKTERVPSDFSPQITWVEGDGKAMLGTKIKKIK